MKTSVLFISIAVLLFAINFNFPLIKEKKHHYITTFTGVPIEKAKSNENQGVLSTPSLHKNTPKTSKTVLNTKENYILPIDEQILVIGKNSEESEEVVSANEVAFNILDELSIQRQAYLEYDLFGLEDFTSVSRSINDGVSMGGKIIKLRYEWSHQVEKISISELKKGINIIRFHILKQANYHYKIKNARIRFAEKINNERKIIVNLPTDISHYGEYFYINGYVQTNDETPYTLYANNTPLYVFNHHFDDVLALPNNDDATIELKAVFDDGFVCSTNVNFNKNKQYHYLFNDKWIVPIYKIIWEPLNENKLNFKGLSLFSEENTVKEKMNITVMGLRNEDMPLLDANMVNVTAQYTGYRC
ncbi:MAG: hypothetical protein GYA62_04810, partial [Bacteroidales bacterium]|nr:hypothetical protein [Bacteroidales bacterium]